MKLSRHGLLTAILVVAALFVGSALAQFLPDPDAYRAAPYPVPGRIGDPVRLRTAEVTVTGVHPAKTIELYGQVSATTGVWVVVDITYEPLRETTLLGGSHPHLRAVDDRLFGGLQPLTNNCGPAQPQLPVACQLPFEVPLDAVEGLRLVIPSEGDVTDSDAITDIDLGLTAQDADAYAATDVQLELEPSRVVIP